jgi:hypothetical protein
MCFVFGFGVGGHTLQRPPAHATNKRMWHVLLQDERNESCQDMFFGWVMTATTTRVARNGPFEREEGGRTASLVMGPWSQTIHGMVETYVESVNVR